MSRPFALVVTCPRCSGVTDMKVDDGKLPPMGTVYEHQTLEAARALPKCDCRRLPVIERDAEGLPVRLLI